MGFLETLFIALFIFVIIVSLIPSTKKMEKTEVEKVLGLIKTLSSEEERMKVLRRNNYNEELCYRALSYITKDGYLMLIAKKNSYSYYILMKLISRLRNDDNIVTALLEHKRADPNCTGYWSLVESALRTFRFGKNEESYRNELVEKMDNCKLFEEKMGEFFLKYADTSSNCIKKEPFTTPVIGSRSATGI